MTAASQYYSVTARVGVPHRHEVAVTIPLVGPQGPAGEGGASTWNDISGKPSTFAPSAHDHQPGEVYADAAFVSQTGGSGRGGIYLRNGSDNGKPLYESPATGDYIWWDSNIDTWYLTSRTGVNLFEITNNTDDFPWETDALWQPIAPQTSNVEVDQASLFDVSDYSSTSVVGLKTPKSGNASSDELVLGSDTRLTNSRTPTAHASTHYTGGSDPLTPANIGAAKDFTEIEVGNTGTSTTTLTTAQLPARVILFIDAATAPSATINLPTPDARQSGLVASIKVQVEGGTADTALITVVHNAANLLSAYSLAEDEGSIDFRWDGYRWVYDANWLLRSSTGRVLELPTTSGTLALTESADSTFRVVGSADATKKVAFEVDTNVPTTSTVALTVPAASGTIARTQDFAAPPAIGNTTRNTGAFTTLSATGQATFSDQITGANATATPPTTTTAAKGLQFALLGGSTGNTAAIYGSHGGTSTLGIGIANSSAGSITQVAAFTSTGLSVNGGTITASAPVLDLSQTWNNAAVTFTGLRFNVTNTASASGSLLMDLQVGGTTQFSVRRDGFVSAANYFRFTALNAGLFLVSVGGNQIAIGASPDHWALFQSTRLQLTGDLSLGRSSSLGQSADTILARDAANTVAQVNGTNAQESRLYGTFTSSTNYQRMTVKSARQTLSALSGASATTTGTFIPDGAVVVGVTTRVATALTGATGYQVGDGTDADRWGDINATALNTTSDNRDWTAGTVECFTAGGEVTLTANTNNFTAGAVEICVFYLAGQAD